MIPVLDRALRALSPMLAELRHLGQVSRIRVDFGPDYGAFAELARGRVELLRKYPVDAQRVVATLVACRERVAELEVEVAAARADERSRVLAEVADMLGVALDDYNEEKLRPMIEACQMGRLPPPWGDAVAARGG